MGSTPDVPSLGYLVWRLSLRWQNEFGRALAPLGVTPAQYAVLASLVGAGRSAARPSQRELADLTGLEPMYVSKLARALERAGLVERAAHPDDPRAVRLVPTERGVEVVRAARRAVRRLEERRLAPLGGPGSLRGTELATALLTLLHHADTARQDTARQDTARQDTARQDTARQDTARRAGPPATRRAPHEDRKGP